MRLPSKNVIGIVAIIGIVGFVGLYLLISQSGVFAPTFPTNPFAGTPYKVYGNPSDYQIVYLVAEGAIADDNLTSPNNLLGEITQADIAYTWAQVMAVDAEKPIEALIVHSSGYALANREWTAAAVRRGLTLATINMGVAEQAELRDSDCDRRKPVVENPLAQHGDYFLSAVHLIYSADTTILAEAINASYDNCKSKAGVTHPVYTTSSSAQGPLQTEDQIMYLTNVLIGDIDSVRDQQPDPAS